MAGMFPSGIVGIAVHPKKPILAIAGAEGFLILWDYQKKGDPLFVNITQFKKEESSKQSDGKVFTAIEFTPDGHEILVAHHSGEIKIMNSEEGQFKNPNPVPRTSESNNNQKVPPVK